MINYLRNDVLLRTIRPVDVNVYSSFAVDPNKNRLLSGSRAQGLYLLNCVIMTSTPDDNRIISAADKITYTRNNHLGETYCREPP